MHRFRRKPETKRSTSVSSVAPFPSPSPPERDHRRTATQELLPPASNFRTSLILPSLSRRFTILRNSAGEPLTAAEVRSRLAQQRVRGTENYLSEEEEDMMIEALERIRRESESYDTVGDLQHPPASPTTSNTFSYSNSFNSQEPRSPSLYPNSHYSRYSNSLSPSSPSLAPSIGTAKPSLSRTERSDNSLFGSGSGRMRDEQYIRLANKHSHRSLQSSPPTFRKADTSTNSPSKSRSSSNASRPMTPPSANAISSPPVSPLAMPPLAHASSSNAGSSHHPSTSMSTSNSSSSAAPSSTSSSSSLKRHKDGSVTPARVRRASMALAQALKDLEAEMGAIAGQDADDAPLNENLIEEELRTSFDRMDPNQGDDDDDDTVLVQGRAIGQPPNPLFAGSPPASTNVKSYWLNDPQSSRPTNTLEHTPTHASSDSSMSSASQSAYVGLSGPYSPTLPSPHLRVGNASPIPRTSEGRVPGYIPGMHRPITPSHNPSNSTSNSDLEGELQRDRERESDGNGLSRSNTTTPRAESSSPMVLGSPLPFRKGEAGRSSKRRSGQRQATSDSYASDGYGSSYSNTGRGQEPQRQRQTTPLPLPTHVTSGSRLERRPSSPLANGSGSGSGSSRPLPLSGSRPGTPAAPASATTSGLISSSPLLSHPSSSISHVRTNSTAESQYSYVDDRAQTSVHGRSDSTMTSDSLRNWQYNGGLAARFYQGQSPAHTRNMSGELDDRSLSSPALPDSPMVETQRIWNEFPSPSSGAGPATGSSVEGLPPATLSGISPLLSSLRQQSPIGFGRASRSDSPRSPTPSGSRRSPGPSKATSPSPAHAASPSTDSMSLYSRHMHSPMSSTGSAFEFDRPSPSRRGTSQTPLQSPSLGPSEPRTQLFLSPILNSSHSSLVSIGSSYHSWEEGSGSLRALYESATSSSDPSGTSNSTDVGESSLSSGPTLIGPGGDQEGLLRKLAGLNKEDIAEMQSKLVMYAKATRDGEGQQGARLPSQSQSQSPHQLPAVSSPAAEWDMKRRPSFGSQSRLMQAEDDSKDIVTYRSPSVQTRQQSPTPPNTSSLAPMTSGRSSSPSSDHASKANALLQSVMDSISSPSSTPPPSSEHINSTPAPAASAKTELANNEDLEQRRHDLASALFPTNEKEAPLVESFKPETPSAPPPISITPPNELPSTSLPGTTAPSPSSSPSPHPAAIPKTPSTPLTQSERLHEDVGRQAAAATAALKSPSSVTLNDDGSSFRRKPGKKIKVSKISSPLFVSSTTSVDVIPIRPSVNGSPAPSPAPSKFSLKMLRGSMRGKHSPPNGDEAVPWQDPSTPSTPSQFAHYPPPSPAAPDVLNNIASPRSGGGMTSYKFPTPAPSPATAVAAASSPASAGRLKGFMARMRRTKRDSPEFGSDQFPSSSLSASPSAAHPEWTADARPAPIPHKSSASSASSRLLAANESSSPSRDSPLRSSPSPSQQVPHSAPLLGSFQAQGNDSVFSSPPPHEQGALQQLFDAASNLGLDQAALSDFLVRSASTSSKATGWTHHKAMAPNRTVGGSVSTTASAVDSPVSSVFRTPSARSPPNRQTSIRRPPSPTTPTPRSRAQQPDDDGNIVVRRTIYIPSDSTSKLPADLQSLVTRKSSMKQPHHRHKRSVSVSSVQSNKSLIDRTPTPPPSRGVRRPSMEPSPPVPQLPPSISRDRTPRLSTQSSIYDPYGTPSTSKIQSPSFSLSSSPSLDAPSPVGGNPPPSTSNGPALQVVEYANGQVVWSVVDGLRSGVDEDWDVEDMIDDSVSYMDRRRSSAITTTSEVSTRTGAGIGGDRADALQVLFKEHRRISSKESNNSYVSRRKVLPPSKTDLRPETKVFYSSTQDIENLIESISRGLDAGSFNILPNQRRDSEQPPVPSLPPLHVQRQASSSSSAVGHA